MSLSSPVALTLAMLALTGCGGRNNESLAQDDERATAEARRGGELEFVAATQREGGHVVLPVTFPDGTSAELVYALELEIAELGVFRTRRARCAAPTPPQPAVIRWRATS